MNKHSDIVLTYQTVLHQLRRLRSKGLIDNEKFQDLEESLVTRIGMEPSSCHRQNKILNELLYEKHDGNITPDQEVVK